jgi:hypothetical protein
MRQAAGGEGIGAPIPQVMQNRSYKSRRIAGRPVLAENGKLWLRAALLSQPASRRTTAPVIGPIPFR